MAKTAKKKKLAYISIAMICILRATLRRKSPSCWTLRREMQSMSITLVHELECEDTGIALLHAHSTGVANHPERDVIIYP
jgi:hypothetical protein